MVKKEKKVPIYMKWWAWVIVFFITALIINYTTEEIPPQETRTHYAPTESLPEEVQEEAVAPVMAFVSTDEQQDEQEEIYDRPATFLIGTDFPAGEYFVMAGAGQFGYVLITRSEQLDISEIIWQKHFENHAIVTLQEGQYITASNATLLPIDDAIIPNFENNTLRAGTYRVGIDMPPGIYTLFPLEDKTGFFQITDGSHFLEARTRERRNFNEPITIALNLGDYFTFMRAEIQK